MRLLDGGVGEEEVENRNSKPHCHAAFNPELVGGDEASPDDSVPNFVRL